MSSSARPTKKAKKSGQPAATGPSAIDDLTALTTAQLYSLSAKRHRDYSREIVRMAQEERDRAHVALQEMQSRLERGEFTSIHSVFCSHHVFCFLINIPSND